MTDADIARFWKFVRRSWGCWEWTGGKDTWGYGRFWLEGQGFGAHRVAWRIEHGSFPGDGMELDHLCMNRACVRVEHLQAVSHKENTRRRSLALRPPVKHGTPAGYNQEIRRGMPTCDECKGAFADYHRLRRQAKKKKGDTP